MFKDYRVNPKYLECLEWNFLRVRGLMGLSQKDLAEMLGYEQSLISGIENGRIKIRPAFYLAMAKLCEEFYNSEDPINESIIRHELMWDFTEKRSKIKRTGYSLEELRDYIIWLSRLD